MNGVTGSGRHRYLAPEQRRFCCWNQGGTALGEPLPSSLETMGVFVFDLLLIGGSVMTGLYYNPSTRDMRSR